ncbi:MAG: hypothetical protein ABIC82_06185, partial [bacterium]
SNKCANHFFNGFRYNPEYDRLIDFFTDLKNVSAYQWAFNSPDNNFDFQDALENNFLRKFFLTDLWLYYKLIKL